MLSDPTFDVSVDMAFSERQRLVLVDYSVGHRDIHSQVPEDGFLPVLLYRHRARVFDVHFRARSVLDYHWRA